MSKTALRKILCALLTIAMVFSTIPFSLGVSAAETENTNAVTITVKDETGEPVEGATVKYTVDSKAQGENFKEGTITTDATGIVTILAAADFTKDDLTLTAEVSKAGFTSAKLEDKEITSDSDNFDVTISNIVIEGVTIEAVNVSYYEGINEPAAKVNGTIEGDEILYKLGNGEFSETCPAMNAAGNYSVTVQVSRDNLTMVRTISSIVTKADLDLTVNPYSGTYDKKEHNAFEIIGLKDGDKCKYVINGDEFIPDSIDKYPTITNAGSYSIEVSVLRNDNYNNFESKFQVEIGLADIDTSIIKANKLVYNGKDQEALSVNLPENSPHTAKFKFKNADTEPTETIPTVKEAGKYTVEVYLASTENNYKSKTFDVEVYVEPAPIYIYFPGYENNNATEITWDGTENTSKDFSVKVSSGIKDVLLPQPEVKYSVSNDNIAEISNSGKLTIKKAGTVDVNATVSTSDTNTNFKESTITIRVFIKQVSNLINNFEKSNIDYVFGTNDGVVSTQTISVKDKNDIGEITYAFGEGDSTGLAIDRNTGKVTVTDYQKLATKLDGDKPFEVTVVANKAVVKETESVIINVPKKDNHKTITFQNIHNWKNIEIHYWGSSTVQDTDWNGTLPKMIPIKHSNNDLTGDYYYLLPKDVKGIVIRGTSNTGALEQTANISPEDMMYIHPQNARDEKDHYLFTNDYWNRTTPKEIVRFADASDSYIISITAITTPEIITYTLELPDSSFDESNWYNSDVVIRLTTPDEYSISTDLESFGSSATFDEDGNSKRIFYLRNEETKAITPAITTKEVIRIDKNAPKADDMSIEYSVPNWFQDILNFFGLGNSEVKITFKVTADQGSPIDKIHWYYNKTENSSSTILASKEGILSATLDESGEFYYATLIIDTDETEQYRGHFSFYATDLAGNTNETSKKNDNTVVIIDTICPEFLEAEYKSTDKDTAPVENNGKIYFSTDVQFSFNVKEANFFEENVIFTINKVGSTIDEQPNVSWSTTDEEDVHIGTFTLSGDGEYMVSVKYTDFSGNTIAKNGATFDEYNYTSVPIVIDKTAATVEIKSLGEEDDSRQGIQISIIDKNFDPNFVSVSYEVTNRHGEPITGPEFNPSKLNWTKSDTPDKYVLTYGFGDFNGIYENIVVSYKDYSKITSSATLDEVTIDHDDPVIDSITYNTTDNPLNTLAKVAGFFFANNKAEVIFTITDNTSDITSVNWKFIPDNTGLALEDYQTEMKGIINNGIEYDEKTKTFKAVLKLPYNEVTQYKGTFSAEATDSFDNTSDSKKAASLLVIDHTSPEVSVSHTNPSATFGNTLYYNNSARIDLSVFEDNFFKENLKVIVTPENGTPYTPELSNWDHYLSAEEGDERFYNNTSFELTTQGKYTFTIDCNDYSGNIMDTYKSETYVIDTTNPSIKVEYSSDTNTTYKDAEGNDRKYFSAPRTAKITIVEENFNGANLEVVYTDIKGNEIDTDTITVAADKWTSSGDEHTYEHPFKDDANYTFNVECTDKATNTSESDVHYFTVDKNAPATPEFFLVTTDKNNKETITTITDHYYSKEVVTLQIQMKDDVSGIAGFEYIYTRDHNASTTNAEYTKAIPVTVDDFNGTANDGLVTARILIPKDHLTADNQFNGNVTFKAYNRAGLSTDHTTNNIIVDNIAPVGKVTFSNPVNKEGNISYYNGNIEATVSITEINFDPNLVDLKLSRNGSVSDVKLGKWARVGNSDTYTNKFTISGDADYFVTLNYKDKSGNKMAEQKSNQLTIDTTNPALNFSIATDSGSRSESGAAFNSDNITLNVHYNDTNFNNLTVTGFTFKRFGTSVSVENSIGISSGTSGTRTHIIDNLPENDGIYEISATITDKANHTIPASFKFIVNRYGSVYEYDDYLIDLLNKQYITNEKDANGNSTPAINKPIVITEYNANEVVADSLRIVVMRDGKIVYNSEKDEKVKDLIKENSSKEGWKKYTYTIPASTFEKDGQYKISLSSAYATAESSDNKSVNIPQNTVDGKNVNVFNTLNANRDTKLDTLSFTVDTTAPEISNIINLDKAIVNSDTLDVTYTVVDAGGIKLIEVYVNDELYATMDEAAGLSYNGTFTLKEKDGGAEKRIKFVITDLAGNVTDTSSDSFSTNDLYKFNSVVTVSTNFFIRFYANKPLFWGSVAGVVLLAAGIIFFATKRKNGDE